jgi:hypothetical protein
MSVDLLPPGGTAPHWMSSDYLLEIRSDLRDVWHVVMEPIVNSVRT